MINYRPWTKSEATALLITGFVWKEKHTGELALCVYIHHKFIQDAKHLLSVNFRKHCERAEKRVWSRPETRGIEMKMEIEMQTELQMKTGG